MVLINKFSSNLSKLYEVYLEKDVQPLMTQISSQGSNISIKVTSTCPNTIQVYRYKLK